LTQSNSNLANSLNAPRDKNKSSKKYAKKKKENAQPKLQSRGILRWGHMQMVWLDSGDSKNMKV